MRAALASALAVLLALVLSGSAWAQHPGTDGAFFASWDGESPFNCEIQDVGTGTDFPRPGDDPFCVRFDKTQQNLTAGGLLEFLLQEPARVAAALDKCFYYQRDHWTGWIEQDSSPELYNFRGSYYIDRGRGGGGALIQDLRVGGLAPPEILQLIPVPNEFVEYFSIGPNGISIGARFSAGMDFEPRCAERISTPEGIAEIYRSGPEPLTDRDFDAHTCHASDGRLRGTLLGPVRLRGRGAALDRRLGAPRSSARGVNTYCLEDGGELRAGFASVRAASVPWGRVRLALVTTGHGVRGVEPGATSAELRRAIGSVRRRMTVRGATVMEARRDRNRRLVFGVRSGRVAWIAVADARWARTDRRLRRLLLDATA